MNTRISDAAVSAACMVVYSNYIGGKRDYRQQCDEEMRDALEAALPHLQPAKPEAVRLPDELRERCTLAATLRAMATNYSGGHSWDHLDADVCRRAADALASVQPSPAGQGDALSMIGSNLRSLLKLAGELPVREAVIRANMKEEIQHALKLLEAALAARQPGEMSVEASQVARGMVAHCIEHRLCMGMNEGFASFDPDVEHPFVQELRGFVDGARQPVGQEPVAWKYQDQHHDGAWEDRFADNLPCWEYRNAVPLYAAPTAQAVDLEQFRYLAQWVKDGCNFLQCDPAKLDSSASELLRAINATESAK